MVASNEGIWECTFVGACSDVCPKHVDPAAAIQQTKISASLDWFKAKLMPGASTDEPPALYPQGRSGAGGSAIPAMSPTWCARLTSLFVGLYCALLVVGLVRLAQGPAAWEGFLAALSSRAGRACSSWSASSSPPITA